MQSGHIFSPGGPGVFLLEPQRTPYDLNFRIFGIPVRVHPMFWLLSAIFGWGYIRLGLQFVLLWVACTFVSILLHELGHVLMGQAFGCRGHIVLYSFGGLAIGSNQERHRWQRIAVSLAGPLAGLLLFGLVWLFREGLMPDVAQQREQPVLASVVRMLLFMNFAWSLLNLLPIWPLDGGQISRELLSGVANRNGVQLSLGISLLVSGVLAIHFLMASYDNPLLPFLERIPYVDRLDPIFSAVFFALLALQSFQLLQQLHSEQRWHDDHWDRGR
jgi:Zn-dependent protease